MSFTSLTFLAFAACFFVGWPLAKRRRSLGHLYIVLASLAFYGWSSPRALLVLVPTALGVFLLALAIDAAGRLRKPLFLLGLAVLVSLLLFFKYRVFLGATAEQILSRVGLDPTGRTSFPRARYFVPLGLSFYTFQALSYLIDVYRRQMRACRNPLQFLAYLSLFPNLIAGPIVRARALLPQLAEPLRSSEPERSEGLRLIVLGFFKKTVIADNLVPEIALAFGGGMAADSTLAWWSIVAAYAMQIYFDFSGYTDIARGLARWIGLDYPLNFDHPYTANSVSNFWSRWHMTLSAWFRDYVFLPISYALSRRIQRETFLGAKVELWIYGLAALATMLLCGFWHGAAWTFILWGAAYGVFMTVERVTKWPRRIRKLPLGGGICVLLVVLQVWTAWVLFRSESLGQAGAVLKRLYWWRGGLDWALGPSATCALLLGVAVEARCFLHWRPRWWPAVASQRALGTLGLALLILAALLFRGPGAGFVYFRF